MPHLTMKFPSLTSEVITVRADQKLARQCYADCLRVCKTKPDEVLNKVRQVNEESPPISVSSVELDPIIDAQELRPQPAKEMERFQLGLEVGESTKIGK